MKTSCDYIFNVLELLVSCAVKWLVLYASAYSDVKILAAHGIGFKSNQVLAWLITVRSGVVHSQPSLYFYTDDLSKTNFDSLRFIFSPSSP